MKKTLLLILASIFGGNFPALADAERAKNLSPIEKKQIAWALQILNDSKTLISEDDNSIKVDQDILAVLAQDGLIEKKGVRVSAVCDVLSK